MTVVVRQLKYKSSIFPVVVSLSVLLAPMTVAQSLGDTAPVRSAIQLADMWLQYQLAKQELPSISVGIVHDQDLVWAKSYGYANIEEQIPATLDTNYSVCSIAKVFTAIAVMQLRDKGELHMDQEVRELIPWFNIKRPFPNSGPITVKGLLTHSSGLPDDLEGPYWVTQDMPTREEFRAQLAEAEMLYPASKYEEYSNIGFVLAGYVVEERSGRPYEAYVQREILDPLEMSNTTVEMPIDDLGGRFATGYSGGGRNHERYAIPPYQTRAFIPAAGMTTSVGDMAKFIRWQFRLLRNGGTEVLKSSTLEEMHRVQWYNSNSPAHRGYGYSVFNRDGKMIIAKDGGCPGYFSLIMLDPSAKIGGVIMVNSNGTDVMSLLRGVVEIVAPAIGMTGASAPSAPESLNALDKYVGVYRQFPADMEVGVITHGNTLAYAYLNSDSPADSLVTLRPAGKNRFIRPRGEEGGNSGYINFVTDEDGRVTAFTQLGNSWEKTH